MSLNALFLYRLNACTTDICSFLKTSYVFLEWRTFSVESLSEVSNWWLLLFHPICFCFTLKKIIIQALSYQKNNRRNKCGEKYDTLYSVDCQAVCFLLTKELDQRAFNGNRIISRYNYKSPPWSYWWLRYRKNWFQDIWQMKVTENLTFQTNPGMESPLIRNLKDF